MAQGQAPGREQARSRLGRGPSRDLPDEHDQVEGGSMTSFTNTKGGAENHFPDAAKMVQHDDPTH